MKIICYGDSNTYGFDPRIGTPGRQAKKDRWTGILDNMPEYEIINEGMNGRTIPDCDAAYNSLGSIIRHNMSADILLIMLGTNDMPQIPCSLCSARMTCSCFAAQRQPCWGNVCVPCSKMFPNSAHSGTARGRGSVSSRPRPRPGAYSSMR